MFLISTGEISLADKIADARIPQRHMPGQAVRFIDLAADAGSGFGLFDHAPEIGGKPDGGTTKDRGDALARNLLDAAQSCFGTAGPAFVELFIANRENSLVETTRLINLFAEQHAAGADGQVQRVARTFGLLAAAGELGVCRAVLCLGLPARQHEPRADASSMVAEPREAPVPAKSPESIPTW